MTLNFVDQEIAIFPQLIGFSERLYRPKYRRLREIVIDYDLTDDPPTSHYEVVDLLSNMPNGFLRDPSFGLGVVKEMRPLIEAIESVEGVTRLVIGEFESTRVERGSFYLNAGEYRLLQQGISRTTRMYQEESLADRRLMAFNASLHRADPTKYPLRERPYKAGTVFKLLGGSKISAVTLRGQDRVGLLQALASNASAIADRDPAEFVQLQKDIEIVSLDKLIDAVRRRINRNSAESAWQSLLEINPFLLSMLFGQPVVLLQAGASVGGQRLTGHGTKIADFLTSNALTHNAALVEIKRPKTPLLNKTEYRGGVLGPSRELMGAVAQVLDQRYKLMTGIMGTKWNNRQIELEVPAVECVVVAGVIPKGEAEIASFELIRHSFKDVQIVTFDELLERLQLLRTLLAGDRYVSPVEDDARAWDDIYEASDHDRDDLGRPDDEDLDPTD
ncbi:Shedu immune nuclease family protein [Sphingomonas rosea]